MPAFLVSQGFGCAAFKTGGGELDIRDEVEGTAEVEVVAATVADAEAGTGRERTGE